MAVPVFSTPAPGAPPAPVRRIGPTPFDSPPYPDMDWQIGGGPNVIGDPGALRDSPFPLMQALYDGPDGEADWPAVMAQWCFPPRRQQGGSLESGSDANTAGAIGEKPNTATSSIAQMRRIPPIVLHFPDSTMGPWQR